MIYKLAVAGAVGAGLFWLLTGDCVLCGFVVGAGVQAGVMILGVS